MAIDICDASITLQSKNILQQVNLCCENGQFIAICGPNGAGKSTLLKAIAGDIEYSGSIRINDCEVNQLKPKTLASLRAVMPQQVTMTFSFAVKDIIAMGLIFSESSDKKSHIMQHVKALFKLDAIWDKSYLELSGGQQQRCQLARVVGQILQSEQQHRFLLLDECSSAMDISMMHEAFTALKQLTEQKIGVIAVVHDVNLASHYADKLCFIHQQSIHLQGTTAEMLTAENIREVFQVESSVLTHPVHQHPVVVVN
ncbi:MAG: ATP-binding cassette domain-containing protein [Pseudomonadales bacterium]|nr:ATP-binding cassette domain-containing protein [Pseudomonadales bacterium]